MLWTYPVLMSKKGEVSTKGNTNINLEMVKKGCAWNYMYYNINNLDFSPLKIRLKMTYREEYQLTAGRVIARHNTCIRDTNTIKRADYVLFYNFHTPIAVIEAKDNKHKISDGMQQALGYAEMLNIKPLCLL